MPPESNRTHTDRRCMLTGRVSPGSYRMIKTLEIKNFRCFESVSLSDLTRVNVITGSNASGKSALLEALFLGARATGDAVLVLNTARGWAPTINPFAAQLLGAMGGAQVPPRLHFDHYFRSSWTDGHLVQAQKFDISYKDTDDVTCFAEYLLPDNRWLSCTDTASVRYRNSACFYSCTCRSR
jgi:hypothetical protein